MSIKAAALFALNRIKPLSTHHWLPVKVKFLEHSNNDPVYLSPSLAYKDGMNINLERPYHPIFSGLNPRMFRLWADYTSYDESKNGFPAIYPVNTGYELQSSSIEDVATLANYSRAPGWYSFYPNCLWGKGSILLSGFDLIDHCEVDPVADKLLSNMILYMAVNKKHEQYVAINDSIIWGDYASERGIS